MFLNTIKSNSKARKPRKRVGRGIGSGCGKTCSRGHKGQKSRSGGYHKVGFEGGQMPLQRRLPKSGFTSRLKKITAEIRLDLLNKFANKEITMNALRAQGFIQSTIKRVKIIGSGTVNSPVKIKGLKATKKAQEAIEKAGGSIEA